MNTQEIFEKAAKSKFWLWVLNKGLHRKIPFNKPHGMWIQKIDQESVEVYIPYKRKNLNHIKGLHACGLATAGEYASGLVLLSQLGVNNYRIIMESIEVKYFYQGKMGAVASYSLTNEVIEKELLVPLQSNEKTYYKCEIPVHDKSGNHLCTVYTNWQIKSWDKVKMKL